MHPSQLSIDDFTYELPDERIAYFPLSNRDDSKLLVYDKSSISEDRYANIADHIEPGSLLFFNNTKVVEARLLFQKPSGGVIELFCLEPHEQYGTITNALQQNGHVIYQCLVGGASKWKNGQVLEKIIEHGHDTIKIEARYLEKREDHFLIDLRWFPESISFAEVLHHAGAMPLPPYIKRKAEKKDEERYQTVYARHDGSVAAPTAGLHFTEAVFDKLKQKNIDTAFLTLHVGAGTFKPVKAATMQDHTMHAEWIEITRETVERIIAQEDKPIVVVGTTSLRTLESLYWMGVKLLQDENDTADLLTQWEPYQLPSDIPLTAAMNALLQKMEKDNTNGWAARTQIIIAPGYTPRVATSLVTNFHQPKSTLLLLVAALIGNDWRKVYDYALTNEFRFLSYGDGSLLRW